MSLTDGVTPETFYFDVLLPLHQARLRRGMASLTPAPSADCASYWQPPTSRTGGVARLPEGAAESDALAALEAMWVGQGDRLLPRIVPELRRLQAAILEDRAAPEQQSVSDFVYPLF